MLTFRPSHLTGAFLLALLFTRCDSERSALDDQMWKLSNKLIQQKLYRDDYEVRLEEEASKPNPNETMIELTRQKLNVTLHAMEDLKAKIAVIREDWLQQYVPYGGERTMRPFQANRTVM